MADKTQKKKSGPRNTQQNDKMKTSIPVSAETSKTITGDSMQSSDETNSEDVWKAFEVELKWCIDQLQKQLSSTKQTQKQSEETLRLIKSLANQKAPLIKKRQIMRTTFGDYRQRMKEEELEFKKNCERMSVVAMESSAHKGVFLKRRTVTVPIPESSVSSDVVDDPSASETRHVNNFAFNFVIDE